MNNNLQLVLKSSTTEMSLNDHDAGIYIVPELDGLTGLPEIRTTSGVNAGYDGGWTSAQKFDARSIVIRGVIANEDKTEVERMRRELVALLAQGKNEQLELDFVTETGRAYEVQVRTIACDMAMQRVLTQQEFMITLRADDPLIYDNSSAGEEATVNVSGATGGFRIPFEIPLAIDAGSEETVIQNSGLESVAPTIKMYGALHNPKIINHTTNQAMQVEAELGFTEGAWTTPVDAPEGTNVSFEPEREAPIESAKLKGDTTQKTYTGKNLIYTTPSEDGGIKFEYDEGTGITSVSGTPTRAYAVSSRKNLSMLSGETYTLSIDRTMPFGVCIGLTDTNNQRNVTVQIGVGHTSASITLSKDITAYDIYVNGLTTGVAISGSFVIQLEKSSSATAIEPYVGGIPAPNPDYPQAVKTIAGEQTINICGKNLLDIGNNLKASDAGLDFSYSNNKLVVSGTPTRTYANVTNEIDTFLAAGQYTLSLSEAASHRVYIWVRYADGAAASLGIINAGSLSVTTTFAKDVVKIRLDFSVMSTQAALNESFSVQLEKGSATAYEPYIEQVYPIKLNAGINYWDNLQSGFLPLSGSYPTSNPSYPNAKYRLVSLKAGQSIRTIFTGSDNGSGRLRWINPATNEIAGVINSGDYEYYSSTHGFGDGFYDAVITANKDFILGFLDIGYGYTQADFTIEPINFDGIELCKLGDYQDYIWKDGDTWKIHKEVGSYTFDGSEAWIRSGSTTASVFVAAIGTTLGNYIQIKMGENSESLMDTFTFNNQQAGNWGRFNMYNGTEYYSALAISFDITKVPDITAAQTWVTDNRPILYGVLATATDTAITNATLIAQLEALVDGNAVVYEGKTNIFVIATDGNMRGITAIRYYTDKEPDQRDELIIDSRLKTITLNGLDVYHLQAPGSEFLMLAPGENKLSLQSDITGDNGYAKVSYKQGYLSI